MCGLVGMVWEEDRKTFCPSPSPFFTSRTSHPGQRDTRNIGDGMIGQLVWGEKVMLTYGAGLVSCCANTGRVMALGPGGFDVRPSLAWI